MLDNEQSCNNTIKLYTREIDPLLKSRIDINQYYNALETAKAFLIQPQGGIEDDLVTILFEIPITANHKME